MKATKQEFEDLASYIRSMADSIELKDWTFVIEHADPVKQNGVTFQATVTCIYGQKRAKLRFCKHFLDLPQEKQRQTVCHELIHCHLKGIEYAFCNLHEIIPQKVYTVVYLQVMDQLELGVDALAIAMEKSRPLPNVRTR